MFFDVLSSDIQAKTAPMKFHSCFTDAEKPLKQLINIFFGDAYAKIPNADNHLLQIGSRVDDDLIGIGGKFNGIIEQINQCTFYSELITLQMILISVSNRIVCLGDIY
jgi:hypothetical protein